MRAAAELDLPALYLQAAAVTAQGSKSFYFATRFFPRDMARAAHAVYWFCRYTDDLADECTSIEEGRRDLESWAAQVRAALDGEPPEHPVLGPFLDTVRKYEIPREYPLELIEGMRMDLAGTRYRTFYELRVFCYRVASVVGLMMSHVIGFRGDPRSYAIDLGIAMQLTNILRDIGEDLARGRVYLPSEEMERFGYSERMLMKRKRDDGFRELMRFQVKRARSYYKAAEPGIGMLSKEGRFAVKIASDVYRTILDQIERSDYNVFDKRAVVPAVQKYRLTARALCHRLFSLCWLSREQLERVPFAVLAGLTVHYLCFYFIGSPLWTETIAERIMAHTPSVYAVPILATLGAWAKPFAMTGALATLGFAVSAGTLLPPWPGCLLAAFAVGATFHYWSWIGQLSFWIPVGLVLNLSSVRLPPHAAASPSRRKFLTESAMLAGVAAVAIESYARNWELARRAVKPIPLWPFSPPQDHFGNGLVRKAVTPVPEFYGMSKNAVDPVVDPRTWRLKITLDGHVVKQLTYAEMLSLPRIERYITLRCISNTLKSDLMGTAAWSGIRLSQIVDRKTLPAGIVEAAIIGIDGHGDSFTLEYAFSDELLLALGMNGQTLTQTHGFPLRLLAPRYYGFKSVKWIAEIAFVAQPYYGTWPKLGYTKEPVIHTASHFDRVVLEHGTIRAGGVSCAGVRGIRAVRLRADQGPWFDAAIEKPLSPCTCTRWYGSIPAAAAKQVEAQALDGTGRWQETSEGPLFPDGVTGPTIRRLSE